MKVICWSLGALSSAMLARVSMRLGAGEKECFGGRGPFVEQQ